MPELPEVETIRRGLAPQLTGQSITGVRVRQPRLRHLVDVKALQEQAVDRMIMSVDRRAKYLLIRLHPDRVLVFHLGMTGRLGVGPPAAEDALHDHLIFQLGPELELRYRDPRRFGMCFLTTEDELPHHPRFDHLGPEPLSPDFSSAYLRERARGSRRPVKNFLMDANIVVGVGNIYASESLYLARVRPTREAGRLRPLHWERIYTAIQHILQAAIDKRGTTRIQRIVQAGRSSYYCPGCQR
jgi:formamidopyrimidine-DNA glycosylase